MKYFIFAFVLCSVQTLFGFPQNKSEDQQITNVIKELEQNFKKITDDFDKFTSRVTENLIDRVEQEEKDAAKQIQNLKRDVLQTVKIDALNAVQKEEKLCYKIVQEGLDKILENATNQIRQCRFHELFFGLIPIHSNQNVTVKMGNDLIDNLESINEGCAYIKNKELCLKKSKLGVDIIVNNLKRSMNQLRKLANETSISVLSTVQECISTEIRTLRNKSQTIRNEAEDCFSFS